MSPRKVEKALKLITYVVGKNCSQCNILDTTNMIKCNGSSMIRLKGDMKA